MKRRLARLLLLLLMTSMALTPASAEELRGYNSRDGYQYVLFGSYPCDEDGRAEPILWRVLAVSNNKALLMSEYILDNHIYLEQEYRTPGAAEREFQNSRLREYMNYTFYNTAFSEQEQYALLRYGNMGRVFVLGKAELTNPSFGFRSDPDAADSARSAFATPYALERGCWADKDTGLSNYWIATPTDHNMYMGRTNGSLGEAKVTRQNVGFRASIFLDTTAWEFSYGSGTLEFPLW